MVVVFLYSSDVKCMEASSLLFFCCELFLGLLFASIGAAFSWGTFINGNVSPDVAAGLTVATFALILGAFGLIAVKVTL